MAPVYAGAGNELFYPNKMMMPFGDAKNMCEDIVGRSSEPRLGRLWVLMTERH
jgi:hypothetical protein